MRKIFTLLLLFLFSTQIFGQELPNGDFENWTKVLTYENPDLWDTPNQESATTMTFGVTKESSDVVSGNHAIVLKTVQLPFVNIVIPGFATLADFTINMTTQNFEIIGGEPFSHRPNYVVGYYKFAPQGGDNCLIGILLSKYNNAEGKIDTIAGGIFESGDAKSEWTYVEIPLEYISMENPDTLNVVILSSSDENNMNVGTTLKVDSLAFGYCNISMDNIDIQDCSTQGASDGKITITASGGSGNLEYSINGGLTYQDNNVFTGLGPFSYAVFIRDKDKDICEVFQGYHEVKDGPNSIRPQIFKNVEIYPNPANDQIFINGLHQGNTNISIFNNIGEQVYYEIHNQKNLNIDLSEYTSGVYFIKFSNQGQSFVQKIVVSQ
jgi:hypothetical protein